MITEVIRDHTSVEHVGRAAQFFKIAEECLGSKQSLRSAAPSQSTRLSGQDMGGAAGVYCSDMANAISEAIINTIPARPIPFSKSARCSFRFAKSASGFLASNS